MTDAGVIRDLEKQRFHALRDGDVDTLDELCLDELVYLHANATRDTKAALLAKLRNRELRCTDALYQPDDDIVLIGDTAIATGRVTGTVYVHGAAVELCNSALLAPLPRTYAWIDCGAYAHPMELIAKLHGDQPPDPARAGRPPFYDGAGQFIASGEPLATLGSEELDIEAELAFVLTDVELGASDKAAGAAIVGVTVVNDISLRDVLRDDLNAGMGIYHAKPPSSMAPVMVTLDELGAGWDGDHVHARMFSWVNGRSIGCPDTGVDIAVTVPELIAQAARTRPLVAGTVLGTGTVSNRDPDVGAACIAELRIRETLAHGSPTTQFLRPGDELVIDLRIGDGSVVGPLHHVIVPSIENTGKGTTRN